VNNHHRQSVSLSHRQSSGGPLYPHRKRWGSSRCSDAPGAYIMYYASRSRHAGIFAYFVRQSHFYLHCVFVSSVVHGVDLLRTKNVHIQYGSVCLFVCLFVCGLTDSDDTPRPPPRRRKSNLDSLRTSRISSEVEDAPTVRVIDRRRGRRHGVDWGGHVQFCPPHFC